MENKLNLEFHMEKQECLWGESLPFQMVLSHTFNEPLNVKTFEPKNRTLVVTIRSQDGNVIEANQMSASERDGIYLEPPREPYGCPLAPGEKLNLKGDLLEWFGPLAPGAYTFLRCIKG